MTLSQASGSPSQHSQSELQTLFQDSRELPIQAETQTGTADISKIWPILSH